MASAPSLSQLLLSVSSSNPLASSIIQLLIPQTQALAALTPLPLPLSLLARLLRILVFQVEGLRLKASVASQARIV